MPAAVACSVAAELGGLVTLAMFQQPLHNGHLTSSPRLGSSCAYPFDDAMSIAASGAAYVAVGRSVNHMHMASSNPPVNMQTLHHQLQRSPILSQRYLVVLLACRLT